GLQLLFRHTKRHSPNGIRQGACLVRLLAGFAGGYFRQRPPGASIEYALGCAVSPRARPLGSIKVCNEGFDRCVKSRAMAASSQNEADWGDGFSERDSNVTDNAASFTDL